MDQATLIGTSVGASAGLVIVLCCIRLCRIIAQNSCMTSRTRVHVEVGDANGKYHIAGDANFKIQIGHKKFNLGESKDDIVHQEKNIETNENKQNKENKEHTIIEIANENPQNTT